MSSPFTEVPDSNTLFKDTEFIASNQDVADQWVSIRDLYPSGVNQPLLPEVFSREQFGQGNHYECFMLSALAPLIRFPDVIRNCFVTKKVRQDGRYTFQFFRGQEWVKVEIDDTIPLEDNAVLYARSPTEHWWPLLLEKAYAKFYTAYDHLEGCTLQETFHDLTGNPVLNIPMNAKLAKAAGVNTKDGLYWLSMGECLLRGDHVLSALTTDADLESIGMQSEQQYAILGIFSLTGSSALDDIVIHLHNPFEDDEYEYSGPLNKKDSKWTAKLRQQYPVDDRYSIFIPLKLFLKSMNSIQHCFMRTIDAVSQTYSAAWEGESAGGNPTFVTWRKNPLFLVRNSGPTELKIVTMIQQEDQRRLSSPDSDTSYAQCGVVVTRFTYQQPIPTFCVTGNSHKTIFKGLFLNSREVANAITIPGHSMCYLVPSCMQKGVEARFQLSLYHFKDQDYSQLSVEPLSIPGMNWVNCATKNVELCQKEKDRVDFYVDEGTDIHILMHQTKPYVSKSGGDAMTEDYMGMYLYDDTDRKIAGVHAATNFREISIIHRLPRSGRYAISITCPRAKGEVPAYITIVGSHASNVRIVDPPEDATMFDDEDIIDEGDDAALVDNPIDYAPVVFDVAHHDEQAESDSPFEDKRFYVDNRGATSEPWVHIGDLYPEGKTRPLLPNELSRDQFGQGDHYDCSTLTAFAALLEHHPDVIRNCFISKNPRKDGRYTFQFHRYGQWIKVEIDDRIPMVKGDTVFCRSPTHHWWPLLLEKAYAKFYMRYENLEGISQEEVFHDYTGQPCVSVSTDPAAAKVNMSYFDEVPYWKELASKLPDLCTTALASGREAEQYGLLKERYYAVLDIVSIANGERVRDMLVKMYNPYEGSPYTGPMNAKDDAWTSELQSRFRPGDDSHAFYIPATNFVTAFSAMQMGYVGGLAEPSRHFNSEWGSGTNGGDTSLISWRENPLFIFSNPTNDIVQVVAMLRQPDQRHLRHAMPNHELVYPMKGLSVAQANPSAEGIPTHLVTFDNHRLIHREEPVAVREVANVLTIPPQSVCYVAGHCNNRAVSKFLLSYWFMRGEDAEKLRIERYRPKVTQHQPAIAHVDLGNRASERVDFLIDTPTEVHALLRQEKAFESHQGGDVIAQDYVGVYLYDLQNNRIKGLPSAMNYREVSLVTHLKTPGHYVFFITCPRSNGGVPCKVEIAAQEEAHARITEAPQNAAPLSTLDMAFLDAHPESIPLSELPIDRDIPFQDDLAALERLLSDPSASAEEIQRLKDRLNERAHALAKAILTSEQPIYLTCHDLHALNPLLNDDQAYMDAERERYYLKQDPRNHYKLPAQEAKLRSIADNIADELLHVDLSFIDARPEGIPRDAIPMSSDKAFAEMTTELLRLRRRPEKNPSAIRDVEHRLGKRAAEIARAMHDAERTYLDQHPEYVPLELLPLNTDERFCADEDELRQLLRSSSADQNTVTALQAKLNKHAHELAQQLKDGERGKLLADSYEGVPTSELPLDTDAAFHEMEVERLRRVRTGTGADAEVARLEGEMRNRARELAVSKKANERVILRGMEIPLTAGQLDALLDKDAETADMERRLRELRKNPDKNATAIKALEKEVQKRAQELADGHLAEERSKYLAAEYGGRAIGTLPLGDDAAYRDAEAAYMKMLESGHADPAALQRLMDTMNERAAGIAHDINVADRAQYVPKALRGVPLRALPLDDDAEFRRLEHERARAACTPGHKAEVAALEAQLLARADELARARLAGDRAYLAPEPAGIPLELVPLDEDAEFCAKEAQRAELKESGQTDRSGIALRETELNARAVEVAQQLKDGERGKLLADSYEGVPTSELPLDTDAAFHEMEVERLRRVRTGTGADAEVARLEGEMRNRARELAVSKKANERVILRGMEIPLTAGQLDALLDKDAETADMERRLRELRKNPDKNAAAIKALEKEVQKRAQELADGHLAEERSKYLAAEYGGRAIGTLPLGDDAAYRDAEAAYMKMLESGHADPAALQRLMDTMNERAAGIAHDINVADRAQYVPKALRGVPLRALPLDDDAEFRRLEHERARAACTPGHKAEVAALEAQLLARADELARARLAGDRAYLAPEPAGIPLELVPLDEDAEFCAKEAQRAELKESGQTDRSGIALRETELNARAVEVAQQLKDGERGKLLADSYEGVPTSELPLDTDAAFHEMEVERLRRVRTGTGADAEVARLEGEMRNRARELAVSKKANERVILRGMEIPLTAGQLDALLDKDAETADMERRLRELRKNPDKNATAIKALEKEVQKRAQELADGHLAEERSKYLAAEYGGRAIGTLPLGDDAAYRDAEAAYMKMLESGHADPAALQWLMDTMNERAAGIAHDINVADRAQYVPKALRGVPLRALPLDDDAEFRRLEHERARAACTPGHKAEVAALEAQLLARADELARARLAGDRAYLAPEPAGIPLELVPLDEDAEFCAKEAQRAELKESGQTDRSGIALRETELNARAVEVAQQLKDGERGKLLADSYEGVPTSELPLDTDAAFHEMEVERLRRVRTGTGADAEVARLEGEMRNRARELAVSKKANERVILRGMEIPLTAGQLDALLDKDAETADMERRLRELRKNPDKNATAIKALEKEVQKRAQELADGHLAEERSKYLAAEYGGRAIGTLPLGDDAAYRDAEAAYMKMLESGHADPAALQWLMDTMNERAAGIAHDINVADRAQYVPKALRGVPLRALPLDDDAEFRRLEHERARAACTPGHKAEVAALEAQLLARADELARARLAGDRAYLAPEPAGIPLELVPLDEDAEFCAKEAQRAELKESGQTDRSGIALRETELNARAVEVAQQLKDGERGKLLADSYEGVPTSELPLDTDAAFHEMEVERLRLKATDTQPNGAKNGSLDAALNRRAAELARSLRVEDLSSVEGSPLGLAKEVLDLHSDSVGAALINDLRKLRKNPLGNAVVLREKGSALNDRAFEVARRLLAGDRASYLDPRPRNILLEHIPLDEDDVFHALEVERSMMKVTDPVNSVAAVRKAENMLKDRACQLAELVMKEDLAQFPSNYHGICTKDLKPHSDRLFSEAAEKRRAGMRDGTVAFKENLDQIMDNRLSELARERKEGELYFIDPNPEGVPLSELPLSTDKAFNDLLQGRQELKESDPMENRKAIAGLEDEMNSRAAELARSVLNSDLDGLDKLPLGIPLDLLKPRQDAGVVRLIEELRRSKRLPQLKNNVVDLQAKLNERLHELATAALEEGRDAYLDPHPEGVPREILPLRTDAVFQKEVQRAILRLQDPVKHAGAIAHLESELKACVKELALAQKEEDLRGLDQHPHDLPLTLLQPHEDAQFGKMIDELRWLKALEGDQHIAVKEVQSRMNDRCYAMADGVMKGDRSYLHPKPEKVPLRRLPLDTDAALHALEVERAKLKLTDPRKNEQKIADLESQLNSRAAELARAVKTADLKPLTQTPRGIPLELLNLHEDPTFSALIAEKEQLPEGHSADLAARLLSSMNECAMKAADKLLRGDRGYLDQDPEGLPLGHLPLDTDTAFHEMEVERALLKARDPVKNSSTIKGLEVQLNKRAHDLSNLALAMDRGYLSPRPEGVSIEELPLFTDSKFHSMEVERAKLKMSRADGNAERMHELEGCLNKRAASLARKQLEEDLKGLDQEPEGYPLNFLRLHSDAVFAAEVVSLRRAKKEPLVSAAKVRDVQEALNVRAHVLARERIAADRARLDQEPENVPLSLLALEEDALFVAMEMELRSLKASDKQNPKAIAEAEGRMNDRVHVMAAKVKAEGRDFLRSKSFDIPKELLALDADKAFVAKEKELWKQKQQPHAPHSSSAAADLRRELQARADEVGEAQLKSDRDKYLDMQPEGVDLCDIPLDTDDVYHGMEVERAILLAQDATGRRSAVEELEKELNARAHELAHEIVVGDRGYLPEEMHGIPVEELPLDTDRKFMKLERQRRAHKRSPDMNKEVAADEEELRNHALKLADEVIAMDLESIKASYRGIAKEELNLHADVAFRELAKKRRRHRGKGRVEAAEVAVIEDEMNRRACEIADDLITAERAFLDPQPEGMYINEVPLDDDPAFQKLEQEYRRRSRDPRSAKQNGDVLRELTSAMNQRSHTLARAAFAKTRGFMEQEQEGIPLAELGLDEDPEFKEAEIARYRMNHSASPNAATVAEMELRMNERARELAWATLAADRVFLDPMPEGVLLEELPLDSDKAFGNLARERRRRKKALKGGIGEAEVRAIEEKMNARSHELAKEFLEAERAFLSREPEGVPLADLPLNADSLFRAMEDERLQLKREPLSNAAMIAAKETDLEHRAHVIAKDLLRKERVLLDQEPLGVPLEELPLNHDEILNPIERKRRELRAHPKRNHEAIRACEEQMVDRVGQIAEDFVQKQRAFLDQNPEGVPLRYLPLNTDREFHERELHRRKLLQRPEKNRSELADTERKMNERVHVLAKDLVLKGRAFLHGEPCGVPIADVPLNEDEDFRKMEEQRRALKEAGRSAASVKTIEEKLNNRAEELAQRLLDDERAFMDCAPLGIPLHDLPLNTDRRMREIERTRRHLRKFDPEGGAVDIAVLETGMNARAYELADQLLSSDRDYLKPEPCGVPLADLPLHTDRIFHEKELARFRAKKKGQTDLFQMEDELNERAKELAAEFIQTERAYLDQEPEGIPLERLPLDTDPIFHNIELERRRLKRSGENSLQVLELESLLNRRAHELSMELRGWQDPEFHAANEHVAEQWVRVCDLYPEGRYEDFVPAVLAPNDVVSALQDMSYLVPFIAALSLHPVLLQRLIVTKEAPVNAPYTFIFFDPQGNPVYIDVDDRVPCDDKSEPKFAQSPYNLWYPLLLEKAYAKFVGGYDQLVNCTPLETLRDLTGRPVTHTPFKRKLAAAGNLDNYTSVDFWLGVKEGMARGDVVVCSSNAEVPNGIHPHCSYALVDVVITLEGSVNPSDVVIKLENSYCKDEPVYTGPLCHTDVNWSLALQRVCQYDPERDDVLYLPLPTFLRNFSSMQTCHTNCGDRLTAEGTWNSRTSGGSAIFTTFRNNPIFILQNSSSRPASVLAELRHAAPQFVDPEGRRHYPQSGIVLMEPTSSTAPLTPLITNSTARFLHKSIILDAREVCCVMEVPARSTCLFIPYTAKAGQHGAFYVSVYPGSAKVTLAPLHYCGLSREPRSTAVTLTPGTEGQRVDFTISSACDVHVLLRQEKMTDRMGAIKGDAIAEDDVMMVAFNEQATKLTSSGDPTNAREHSLVFRAEKPGYYSLLLISPNQPVSGDNPCTVSIFTPKQVMVRFVAPPAGARQLQHARFPKLPQKRAAASGGNSSRQPRGASTACQSQQRQHDEKLPPLRGNGASTLNSGRVSGGDRFTCSF
ncbi:putative calpain-like cysteine peptidase [Leishmania major strain Friedlin]|uniref:Putative calpain-like cysteine peptidase n=1 Tax=Leishmania major TaxID=5664 RepID=E9AD28_LEIMA|nr:putative calpain-like cysteine peptidase [Leishmania major strain Friedlin]CBZ12111.1 putative calpain-like cysteine peptidase [Leishmania major strain Friedlin]|eukprot:XP_003721857.1 putative calpain-like cysteine peptidase [Leishmania major strain Friedlin]